jgi:hypothetical protein
MKIETWQNRRSTSVEKALVRANTMGTPREHQFFEQDFKAAKSGSQVNSETRNRLNTKTNLGDIVATSVISAAASAANNWNQERIAEKKAQGQQGAKDLANEYVKKYVSAAAVRAGATTGAGLYTVSEGGSVTLNSTSVEENTAAIYQAAVDNITEQVEGNEHAKDVIGYFKESVSNIDSQTNDIINNTAISGAFSVIDGTTKLGFANAKNKFDIQAEVERAKKVMLNGKRYYSDGQIDLFAQQSQISSEKNGLDSALKSLEAYAIISGDDDAFNTTYSALLDTFTSGAYSNVSGEHMSKVRGAAKNIKDLAIERNRVRRVANFHKDNRNGEINREDPYSVYTPERAEDIINQQIKPKAETTPLQKQAHTTKTNRLLREIDDGTLKRRLQEQGEWDYGISNFDNHERYLQEYDFQHSNQNNSQINSWINTRRDEVVASGLIKVEAQIKGITLGLGNAEDLAEVAANINLLTPAVSSDIQAQLVANATLFQSISQETTADIDSGKINNPDEFTHPDALAAQYISPNTLPRQIKEITGVSNIEDTEWQKVSDQLYAESGSLQWLAGRIDRTANSNDTIEKMVKDMDAYIAVHPELGLTSDMETLKANKDARELWKSANNITKAQAQLLGALKSSYISLKKPIEEYRAREKAKQDRIDSYNKAKALKNRGN